jgi:hypothetical protein
MSNYQLFKKLKLRQKKIKEKNISKTLAIGGYSLLGKIKETSLHTLIVLN